jgi:hypothetical protein
MVSTAPPWKTRSAGGGGRVVEGGGALAGAAVVGGSGVEEGGEEDVEEVAASGTVAAARVESGEAAEVPGSVLAEHAPMTATTARAPSSRLIAASVQCGGPGGKEPPAAPPHRGAPAGPASLG